MDSTAPPFGNGGHVHLAFASQADAEPLGQRIGLRPVRRGSRSIEIRIAAGSIHARLLRRDLLLRRSRLFHRDLLPLARPPHQLFDARLEAA